MQKRVNSIDLLRGTVLILMALDHVRTFFFSTPFSPTDLSHTTAALFITRWLTHFCAPAFIFLAGVSAFLYGTKQKTKEELARFLFIRGFWLIFLELTVVKFGWFLSLDYHNFLGAVIWAIGWSMIALAGLVFLPNWATITFGLSMIVGHNLFDGLSPKDFGPLHGLWTVLHAPGQINPFPSIHLIIVYPLIPWVGVMAVGYGFGVLLQREEEQRRKYLIWLGSALIVAFFVVRTVNRYGDPMPWSVQKNCLFTALSFLNCQKYPPSLSYLLMTLGPTIVALGVLDRTRGHLADRVAIFGRVPLFYYLIHLPIIHIAGRLFNYACRLNVPGMVMIREDSSYNLALVYIVWIVVLLLLFPMCRWYAQVKQRRSSKWLSYL